MADEVDDLLPLVRRLEGSADNAVSQPKNPKLEPAVGRYQIQPGTAHTNGFPEATADLLKDPDYNEKVARKIIGNLAGRYRDPNDPSKVDTEAVLAGYNGGPGVANRYLANNRDKSVLPDETQVYIAKAALPATAQPPKQVSPMQDKLNQARAAGYSWDEINQAFSERRQQAKAAGYSDEEIDKALGKQDPAPAVQGLKDQFAANQRLAQPEAKQAETPKATTTQDPLAAFVAGVDQSSGGVVANLLHDSGLPHNVILPENAPMATRIAMKAGEAIGDIPAMVAGIIGSTAAGAGAVATTAAAFALPQGLKSAYHEGLMRNQWNSPQDFAEHWAAALWQTTKAGVVGAATGLTGGLTAPLGLVAKTGAELATMTTAAAGLEGRLPSMQDFTDGAIILGGLHIAGAGTGTIMDNLGRHWMATGEFPIDAANRAQNDGRFQQQMILPSEPKVPPTASVTPTKEGDLVLEPVVSSEARLLSRAFDRVQEKEDLELGLGEAGTVPPKPPAGPNIEPGVPSADPWASVGSRIADEPPGKTWVEKAKTMAYEAYLGMFNPQHPINQITRAMAEGGPIKDAENPDFVSRLAENSNTRAMYALERGAVDAKGNKIGPALNDIMGRFETPEERQRFRTYAVARWALEKADRAKETGVQLTDAQQVVKEGGAAYEKSFQDLVGFQNTTLGWLRDSGVISASAHDAMVSENAARIPGYREGKQAREVPGAPGGGKPVNNPLKEFLGSERKILPIETSIMRDTFKRAALADRAYANRVAADGAEPLGLATKVGEASLPKTPAERWLDDEVDNQDDALAKLAETHLKAEEVPVMRDGKMEKWVFSDPNVARVLRGYDKSDLTLLQKLAKPFANFQRAMIVLNPLFAPKVLWYDTQFQFLTKPGLRNTPADLISGLRGVFGNSEGYDAWVRSGGADHVFEWGGSQQYIKDYLRGKGDPSFTDKVWNVVNTPVKALQAWNQSWFSVMRAGRFIRGQEQGETVEQSAVASTEAAFHRANWGGAQSKTINAVQPFFAAYLNGLEQTFKAYSGRNFAGDQTMSGKDVALNWTKAIATVTMAGLADWWLHKDEPWYKAAPAWQKDNGIFIGGGNTHMFLPFPPLIGFLFNGLPKRVMQSYYEHDPDAFSNLAQGGAGAFAPPAGLFTMSAFLPIVEHLANHSFFRDAPLVTDGEKKNLTPEQFGNYSSETAKTISRYVSSAPIISNFGLSPPVIDNYIQGWSGTLGMAAVRATEAGLSAANVIRAREPAKNWDEMPLISSFFARYPTASAQPIKDFGTTMDHFEQVHSSLVTTIKSDNFSRFQEIINENPAAAGAHVFSLKYGQAPPDAARFVAQLRQAQQSENPWMKKVLETQRAIKVQREQIEATYLNSRLNPRDKRQIMDQGYAMLQQMAEQGNRYAQQAGLK